MPPVGHACPPPVAMHVPVTMHSPSLHMTPFATQVPLCHAQLNPFDHAWPHLPYMPPSSPCMPPSPCRDPLAMHDPLCHACPLCHTHLPLHMYDTPLWTDMTDRCENTTFPKLLLSTVMKMLTKKGEICLAYQQYRHVSEIWPRVNVFPVAGSVQGPADLWDDGVLRPRDAQVRDDDEHPSSRGHHLRREEGSSIPVKGIQFV